MFAATDLHEHLFWITSRAAGTLALVFASLSVTLGLLMSTPLARRRKPDLRVTHEALSLATIAALLVHAFALLGDGYLKPSLADIAIPFVSDYRTFWMSLGIVAGWALVVLGLSYYARARIGAERWKRLHRLTALAWIAGVAHGLAMGTDAGSLWFLVTVGAVVLPAAALLVWRHSGTSQPRPTVSSQTRPKVTA